MRASVTDRISVYRCRELDGTTLCRKLQSDPQTASVPIIVLTASGPTAAAASSADAYLVKPFDLDLLLQLVARYAGPPAPAQC